MASREQRSGCGRIVLGCAGVVLILLLGTCVLGGYAYRLWHRQPDGWTRTMAARATRTPEARRQVAVALENRLTRELTFTPETIQAYANGLQTARPETQTGEPESKTFDREKTVRIGTDELNAWLAERLRPWAANHGKPIPSGINDFAYWVEDGLPVVAAHVETEGVGQVVSIKFQPTIRHDGLATLTIVSVRGGELPIPMERFHERVKQGLGGNLEGDALRQAVRLLEGGAFEPMMPVRDGEQVRVTGVTVTEEAIELTVQREQTDGAPVLR